MSPLPCREIRHIIPNMTMAGEDSLKYIEVNEKPIRDARQNRDPRQSKIQIETVSEDGFRGVLTVVFDTVSGYRFLDEGDLYYYFSSAAFKKPYHIYKVLAGGWVNGEICQPDLLQVSKAMNIQEWFLATNNGCITVLSNCQPNIDWQRA